jgi:hypothetical protein
MDLANRLAESRKVPTFIVNGPCGGTPIDQHQRDDENPTDLDTIVKDRTNPATRIGLKTSHFEEQMITEKKRIEATC